MVWEMNLHFSTFCFNVVHARFGSTLANSWCSRKDTLFVLDKIMSLCASLPHSSCLMYLIIHVSYFISCCWRVLRGARGMLNIPCSNCGIPSTIIMMNHEDITLFCFKSWQQKQHLCRNSICFFTLIRLGYSLELEFHDF